MQGSTANGHIRTGGQLPTVLMRPTPSYLSKLRGGTGGGGQLGGGRLEGVWGVLAARPGGGGSQGGGACAGPTTTTCIPPGGCVSEGLGVWRYVCDNSAFSSLPGKKS